MENIVTHIGLCSQRNSVMSV